MKTDDIKAIEMEYEVSLTNWKPKNGKYRMSLDVGHRTRFGIFEFETISVKRGEAVSEAVSRFIKSI